jgi:hypothetical protein
MSSSEEGEFQDLIVPPPSMVVSASVGMPNEFMRDSVAAYEIVSRAEGLRRDSVRKSFDLTGREQISFAYLSGCTYDAAANEIVTSKELQLRTAYRGQIALETSHLTEALSEGQDLRQRCLSHCETQARDPMSKRDRWVRLFRYVNQHLRRHAMFNPLTAYCDANIKKAAKLMEPLAELTILDQVLLWLQFIDDSVGH